MTTGEPTSDEVVAALRASGWLLEQETAVALTKAGYSAKLGYAYQDADDSATSREVDVFGYREIFRSEELRMSADVRILAECKYSSAPYAFVGRPLTDRERTEAPAEHSLEEPTIMISERGRDGTEVLRIRPAWEMLALHTLPGSPNLDDFRATQMTRLDRKKTWEADNRGIFNSLVYPLAKALRSVQSNARAQRGHHDRKHTWARVLLMYPIVVTTATLWAVDASVRPFTATERDWVTMTRQLRSKTLEGQFNIDVVNFDHLASYLSQRIGVFADGVAAKLDQDPEAFLLYEVK